ncbi:uncharacterized protein LOC108594669 [Drosophila busckii]|uniref:uncharacterized protein LOC108594669 n=1 Tax=Drosophila busckii TaxID=30019 RepID=UPI00083ED921|nr:uncharacterized protein LOC108594669 [Drosophila busckii]
MVAENAEKGASIGIRHLQAVLLFAVMSINFVVRFNVGVCVVAMTDAATTNPDFPEFDWTEGQKSYIFSSFYWGYVFANFMAGFLVRRFGAQSLLLFTTLSTGLLCAVTPLFISWWEWRAYCAMRILLGIFSGTLFASTHHHLAKWSPPKERNRLGAFAYSGAYCGTVLATAISGPTASSSWGWPGIFYVCAGICALVGLLWWLLSDKNPPSSRWISQAELVYIESSLHREEGFHAQKIPIPWRAIFTSVPFISITVVGIAQGWANVTMQVQTPVYLHGVLQMDINNNALYSSLPNLVKWIMSYVFLAFADVSTTRNWMSQTKLCKLLNTLATWGPALILMGIGLLDKNHIELAVALLILNAALNAGADIGSILPLTDLSPNHTAMLMSISNGFVCIVTLFSPLFVGVAVADTSSRGQWQIVFAVTAAIFFLGNLVYIIWGSSEQQPWDAADYLKVKDVEQTHSDKKGPRIGIRHLQALLLFMLITVNFIARLNVGVSLVAMTNSASANPDFPEYNWTEAQKSYIISSFFWSYVLCNFVAGLIVRRFGAKLTLFVMTLGTGLLCALTPYCISWAGWRAYCVIRILQGVLQGMLFPSMHHHLAKWSPPKESNRLGAFVYTGCNCGAILGLALSGPIASSAWGWPGIHNVSAALCGLGALLWWLLSADNAPSCRFVSKQELQYIERSLHREEGFHAQRIPIPWRALLSSAPFISLAVVGLAQCWSNSMRLEQTPFYMAGVLELDISSNALYSALPSVARWIASYVCMLFAELAAKRKWLSETNVCKVLNTLATWAPAALLVGIGFLDKSQAQLAVALMTLNGGLNAGVDIGSLLPVNSMSPNHAGVLMALVNGISQIFALVAPLAVGIIVSDQTSRVQWQIVFALTAVIFFLGNLVYIIWGSSELQPWDAADYLKLNNVEQSGSNSNQVNQTTDKATEASS